MTKIEIHTTGVQFHVDTDDSKTIRSAFAAALGGIVKWHHIENRDGIVLIHVTNAAEERDDFRVLEANMP